MLLFEPHLDADYAHLTIKELTSNKEPFYDYSTSKWSKMDWSYRFHQCLSKISSTKFNLGYELGCTDSFSEFGNDTSNF